MLVALAWDAHVHHEAATSWFDALDRPWATCAITEAGFVRVSSNPRALAGALTVSAAQDVLRQLRDAGEHRFVPVDVSLVDADLPRMTGYRQVTDAVLLTAARRAGLPLVTFDAAVAALGEDGGGVELLRR